MRVVRLRPHAVCPPDAAAAARYGSGLERAAVFALATLVLTVAAHVLGHGDAGRLAWLAPLLVLAAWCRQVLVARWRSRSLTTAVVVGLQALGHALLGASTHSGAAHSGHGPGVQQLTVLNCGGGSETLLVVAPSGTPAGADPLLLGMSPGMLAAHTVAALALAWWLHRGEMAAWARAGMWLARVRLVSLRPGLPEHAVVRVFWVEPQRLTARLPVVDAPGRAPPCFV